MPTEYTRPVDLDQAVPLERLAPWLRDQLPDLGTDLQVQQLAGGASNLTFRLSDGTHDLVLRRPPLKGGLATAHDMGREFRVQHGLADTDVPVAPMVALCDDDTVIGVPFYVMQWLDGIVYDDVDAVADLSPEVSRAAAFELVDVLATLHAVEPATVGLGDFGRPEGFLERQMRRWQTPVGGVQDHGDAGARRPGRSSVEGAADRLPARRSCTATTASTTPCSDGTTARRSAPSSTGSSRPSATRSPTSGRSRPTGERPARSCGGDEHPRPIGPTPASQRSTVLLDRYAATSGADLSRIDFYQAFALFKLAVISQGALRRLGDGDPERANRTLDTVGKLTDLAAATLRGG